MEEASRKMEIDESKDLFVSGPTSMSESCSESESSEIEKVSTQKGLVEETQDSGAGSEEGVGNDKDVLIKMLDEMDIRVDKLRSATIMLENEKDDILTTLGVLGNAEMFSQLAAVDRDEVNRYLDRTIRRCLGCVVEVNAERSRPQLESLHVVNNMIDGLIRDSKAEGADIILRRCVAYLNACSEEINKQVPDVGIDSAFENVVLGCCVEDQKRIRKRLAGLFSYYNSSGCLVEAEEEEYVLVEKTIKRSLEEK